MKVQIVLGAAFGDEGKGVTTQYLVKEALSRNEKVAVVRFSGGPQAAHTIVNNGIEHICSSYGSGVLLGVPTIYTSEVFFDPICAYNEYKVLKDKCPILNPTLYLAAYQRVITPYDVIAGRNNLKVLKDGTCGKGLYTTFKRYQSASYETVYSFSIDKWHNILKKARFRYNIDINEELEDLYDEAIRKLPKQYIMNTEYQLNQYDTIIVEGTQGLLLDMDNGFYPNVTPSKVGLNGIPYYLLNNAEVFLVSRTYLTRHGNGYVPKYKCPYDLSTKHETNVYNDYQGNFKVGDIEWDLLNFAYHRHCIDNYIKQYNITLNMVFTHLDILPVGVDFFDIAKRNIKFHVDNFYGNASINSNLLHY